MGFTHQVYAAFTDELSKIATDEASKEAGLFSSIKPIKKLSPSAAEEVGNLVKKQLDSGEYKHVAGVFNRRTPKPTLPPEPMTAAYPPTK